MESRKKSAPRQQICLRALTLPTRQWRPCSIASVQDAVTSLTCHWWKAWLVSCPAGSFPSLVLANFLGAREARTALLPFTKRSTRPIFRLHLGLATTPFGTASGRRSDGQTLGRIQNMPLTE